MRIGNQIHSLKERIMRKEYRKLYYTIFLAMIVLVFFYTVYSLIHPAITLETMQDALDCSLSVHQHTVECYNEDGTLICGEANSVIHTHNEYCYNADGRLVCRLPEIAAHEHIDECYEEQQILICTNKEDGHTHGDACYKTEKRLICEETAILHSHDDTCYDENGTLICGMIQLTEHNHGAECLPAAEETSTAIENVTTETTSTDTGTTDTTTTTAATSDVTTATADTASIMLAAEAASEETCGYDGDSIWWSDKAILEKFTSDNIKENTPYIIAGNMGKNVLTNTPCSESEMSTYHPPTNIAYKSYEIWYFEKTGETADQYYIHDLNGKYLKMENISGDSASVSLTEKADATVFTVKQVEQSELYDSCVTIQSDIGKYVNISGGDKYCHGKWSGWKNPDDGSCLRIMKLTSERQTAEKIKTVSSPNTVINLFDYWTSDDPAHRYDPDNTAAELEKGINKGHDLKFVHGDQDGTDKINLWTGEGKNPLQGIVNNQLGGDRYPALYGTGTNESLKYLFDPSFDHVGKQSYRNVSGLLKINEEGYYYFNSAENVAEFDEESKSIKVYDKPSSSGQFFPFNKAPEVMTLTRDDEKINHYFGATITTRFVQNDGGYADINHSSPTTFEFSGDDDVWIFIDDVLVGDVGGIHDKASVTINFATGNVKVCVDKGEDSKTPQITTLKECYDKAGKYLDSEWVVNENGEYIYKDNTVHTLKFFYLERGNFDSNMMLKYNLTAVPKSAIYKVNQYGEKVKGATFAVYAADDKYGMLSDLGTKGGVPVNPPEPIEYDANGNILDKNNNILAKALYTGTTDENGEMVFLDEDKMPYSINELDNMFGKHFILREIKVPDGYRVVSKDVHLQIWGGENQKILKCDNTTESGSRAAANMQITATDTLYFNNNREYEGKDHVTYCNDQGETTGTLFAVVYRRVDDSWVPVYGDDSVGYTMVDMNGKLQMDGALEAAKEANKIDNICFEHSPSGTMELTLKNLPGHITNYYHMMAADQRDQAQYTVAYYWTSESSLANAIPENTYWVNSSGGTTAQGVQYSGFKLVYGADIHVPNLINKVFVQKVDEKKNLINDAKFAIYKVKQLADGKIQYLADDNEYHLLSDKAVVDDNGVITDVGFTITPDQDEEVKKAGDLEDGVHTSGTVEFTNLSEGQYIIKEVKAPPGYKLNTADVMVLVTEDTIYANAGTEDDGIAVGRGPGHLVNPLNQFASQGQIDNTLTWIYAQMKITEVSQFFSDVGNEAKIKGYISENYTSKFSVEESEAFKTYLRYKASDDTTKHIHNYDKYPDDRKESNSRRIFTKTGWSYYEIYQDYSYGVDKANKSGANYEYLGKNNLANLFSRSTYIRITDEKKPSLKVKKVDAENEETVLVGAKFRLYMEENGTAPRRYYCLDPENQTANWSDDEKKALIITTDKNGIADQNFIGLSDGVYYLEEVESPAGYGKLSEPLKLALNENGFTLDPETEKPPDNKWIARVDKPDENDPHTYTVTVFNYPSFELPATGGCGTAPYTIGGFLLIAVSLVYLYGKKCRNERMMK